MFPRFVWMKKKLYHKMLEDYGLIIGKTNVNVSELRGKNENQSLKLQNKGFTKKLHCLYSKYEHFKYKKHTKLSQLKSVIHYYASITRDRICQSVTYSKV